MTDPLTLAAHYLRRLADVEDAHQRGAVRELDGLLAGVDPVEVRRLAEAIGQPQLSLPVPLPPPSVPHEFIEKGGLGFGRVTVRPL